MPPPNRPAPKPPSEGTSQAPPGRPNRPAPKPPSEGTSQAPPGKGNQLGLPPKGPAPFPSGGSQGGGRKRKRSGKKRKASARFLDAGKAWRAHLDEYRKAHPNMSLKQQMKGAKKTYKKSKSKSQPIHVKDTRYSVQIRPRTRKAGKRKTKRPKKRTTKKKRSLFGLF